MPGVAALKVAPGSSALQRRRPSAAVLRLAATLLVMLGLVWAAVRPASAAVITRFTGVVAGGSITQTGNTLALSANAPSPTDAIGALITTDLTAPPAPGYPVGTTTNWQRDSSSAVLNLPAGAKVLYAELIWSYTSVSNSGKVPVPAALGAQPIAFSGPFGTQLVSPDPTTTSDTPDPAAPTRVYSVRSAIVTPLLAAATVAGTYTVGAVPAVIDPNETGTASGWSLAVVYSNPAIPTLRALNVFVGSSVVGANFTGQLVQLTGFKTPPTGTPTARLSISALEGDSAKTGDQFRFNAAAVPITGLGPANDLSGRNNATTNFFASQVNYGNPPDPGFAGQPSGTLDPTGTFGTLNQAPPGVAPQRRQGWDITNVDGSAQVSNNDTFAAFQGTSNGDGYVITVLGSQIDVFQPVLNIKKSSNAPWLPGQTGAQYRLDVSNTGSAATAGAITILDQLPAGLTAITTGPPFTTAQNGFLCTVNATQLVTCTTNRSIANTPAGNTFITLPVNVGLVPEGTVTNYAAIGGGGDPFNGGVPFTPVTGCVDLTHCANLPTTIETFKGQVVKSVQLATDADGNGVPSPGDTLSWTVAFSNTGTATITNAQVADVLPANTAIVPGSAAIVSQSGTAPPAAANTAFDGAGNQNLLTAGAAIGPAGNIVVAFRVTINAGFTGQLTNQAVGTALTGVSVPSSAVDGSTTGLPPGVVVPPGSLPQGPNGNPNTGPPIPGPTRVNVVAPAASVLKSVALTTDADGNGAPTPGDTLTWTIALANTGTAPIPAAQIVDALPANTAIVPGSAAIVNSSGVSVTPTANAAFDGAANQTLIGNAVTLEPTGVITVSFRVTIDAGFAGTLANRASGRGNGLPPTGVPSSAVDTTTTGLPAGVIVPTGSIPQGPGGAPNTGPPIDRATLVIVVAPTAAVIKSVQLTTDADGNGVPSPGDTLTWRVALANTGTVAIPAAQLTDTLPANTTIVAGSATLVSSTGATPAATANAAFDGAANKNLLTAGVDLAPGGVVIVTFRVTINAGFGGTLLNSATATGNGLPPTGVPSSAADGTTTGLPAGVTVPAGSIGQGLNGAPNTGPPIPGPTRVIVVQPVAALIKSVRLLTDADHNGVPSPGDTLTWTISYANTSAVNIPGSQITDALPANTTIVAGSATLVSASGVAPPPVANAAFDGNANRNLLAAPFTIGPGGVVTVSFNVTINAGFSGTLLDRAIATGGGLPPAGLNSSAADNATTGLPAGVTVPPNSLPQGAGGQPNAGPPIDGPTRVVVVAANAFGIKSVLLAVDADGNGVLTPGDTLRWTIAYKNTGTAPLSGAQLSDSLQTNTTIVAGSVAIVTETGVSPAAAPNPAFDGRTNQTLLAAAVRIAPGGTIVVAFNSTLNAGDTAPAVNRADLTGNGLPAAGVPSFAADTTTTGLPAGITVPTGSLPQGPPENGPPLDQSTIAKPATIAADVIKSVKLTTDAAGNGVASPGDTLTWTIAFANTGTAPIPAAQMTDTLPANTTIVPGSAALVTASGTTPAPVANVAFDGNGTKSLIADAVTLAPGGAIVVSFKVTINAGFTGTLLNSAIGSGRGLPPAGVPSSAADSSTTTLPPGVVIAPGSEPQGPGGQPNGGPPIPGPTRVVVAASNSIGIKSVQLTTDADGNGVLTPGDTLTWTITYENNASVPIPDAQITDTLDANTTLVPASAAIVAQTGVTPAAVANAAFNGTATKTLLLAPVRIAPGGLLTVRFRAILNAGTTIPVSDRAFLTGGGLPAAGIPTDAADNATTGLPPGVVVPTSSLPQGPNGKPNAGAPLNAATFAVPATISAAGIKSVAITARANGNPSTSSEAMPGDTLTWTVAYGNTGTAPIPNAQITDALPANTAFVTGSVRIVSSSGVTPAPAANAAYNGGAVKSFLSAPVTLAPGALIVVSFAVTVDAGFTGAILNRALLNGGGLPAAGIETDAADNATQGLPPGSSAPPGSVPQGPNSQPNNGPPLNGPTKVNSAAPNLSPLLVQKSVDREVASSGDRLIYTIVATNPNNVALGLTTIVDNLPGGVAYANGSTRIDGVPAPDPVKAGSTLSWSVPATGAKGQHTVVFAAVIAPGIPVGTILTNTANANAKVPGTNTTLASGNAQAQTRVIGGIFNDCVTILGRVFVNHDDSGRFGRDDVGLPNVRIYLESGEYVTTDRYGKYNFACVRPGMHVLRLDTLTLPPGTAPYNVRNFDDPRSVQRLAHGTLDAGLIQNINFAIRGAP